MAADVYGPGGLEEYGILTGGEPGQVLMKVSEIDFDTEWKHILQALAPVSLSSTDPAMVPLTVAGIGGQSADLQKWTDSTGLVLARVASGGRLSAERGADFSVSDISHVNLVVQAMVGQTANISEWKRDDGATRMYVTPAGNLVLSDSASARRLSLTAGAVGDVPIIVRAFTGHTANLTEWRNVNNTVQAGITPLGSLFLTSAQLNSAALSVVPETSGRPGIVVRGVASQAGDLVQLQDSAGTVLSRMDAFGRLGLRTSAGMSSAVLAVQTDGAASLGAAIRGVSGQTGDLTQWQDSAGTVLSRVNASGSFVGASASSYFGTSSLFNASLNVQPLATNWHGIVVRALSGQTGNLQQWQNSTGTVLSQVAADGVIGAPGALLNSAAGSVAELAYTSDGSTRWRAGKTATAESGANAGSGYSIAAYSDTGSYLFAPFAITRSSGLVSLSRGVFMQPASASSVAEIVRGLASQTGVLTQWQDSAGAVLSQIKAGGGVEVLAANGSGFGGSSVGSTMLTTYATGAGVLPLLVRGYSGQTADLTQWQDSTGAVLSRVNPAGSLYLTSGVLGLGDSTVTKTSGFPFILGSGVQAPYAWILGVGAGITPLISRGAASQTANLQEWQNSSGSALSYVSASGVLNAPYARLGQVGSDGSTTLLITHHTGAPATNRTLTVRAVASQTGDLQQWQDVNGSSVAGVDSTGKAYVGTTASFGNVSLSVAPKAAGGTGLIIRALASQTGNLQQFEDSVGGQLAMFSSTGGLTIQPPGDIERSHLNFKAQGITGPANIIWTYSRRTGGDELWLYGYDGTTFKNVVKYNYASRSIVHDVNSASFMAQDPAQTPTVIRAAASHTGDLTAWQNSAGSIVSRVDGAGYFRGAVFRGLVTGGPTIEPTTTAITVYAQGAGNLPLNIRGAASQTANLQEWQASDGTIRARFNNNGALVLSSVNNPNMLVSPPAATLVGVVVRGAPSQTASLQEWQDSAGTSVGVLGPTGTLTVGYVQVRPSSANEGGEIQLNGGTNDGITAHPTWWIDTNTTNFRIFSGAGQKFNINDNGAAQLFGSLRIGQVVNDGTYPLLVSHPTGAAASQKTIGVRAVAGQTGDLTQWQDSVGAVLSRITRDGDWFNGTSYFRGNASATANGNLLAAIAPTAAVVPLIVRGAASQSVDLQVWQTSDGSTQSAVISNGKFRIRTAPLGGSLDVAPSSTNAVGLITRALASQTADVQQWQDSAGAVTAAIKADGSVPGWNIAATAWSNSEEGGTGLTFRSTNALKWNTRFALKSDASGVPRLAISSVGSVDGTPGAEAIQIYEHRIVFPSVNATQVPVSVQGASGQTGDLTQWRDSAGTTIARITPNGSFATANDVTVTGVLGLNAAPGIYNSKMAVHTGAAVGIISLASAITTVPIVSRGFTGQTADLQHWQDSTGAAVSRVTASGGFSTANRLTAGSSAMQTWGILNVNTAGAGNIGAVIRGAASQTANLQEWQDSVGTVLGSFGPGGSLTAGGRLIAGGSIGAQLDVAIGPPDRVGAIIRGNSSQTADLQQWQNSGGVAMVRFLPSGSVIFEGNGPRLIIGGSDPGARLNVTSGSAAQVALALRGFASQTADLQQWQVADGSVRSIIDPFGNLGVRTANLGGALSVQAPAASSMGIIVRAFASQTSSLQEWQDSSGNVLARINAGGHIYTTSPVGIGTYMVQNNVLGSADLTVKEANAGRKLILDGKTMVENRVDGVAKAQQTNDFEVLTAGAGIIFKSPNGTRYRMTVSDLGAPIFAAA